MSGNPSKSTFFEGGWVTLNVDFTLNADFRGKGASPTNHCWCQKTRVIVVSCGIKIFRSSSFSFVTIHASDGRTDRQTDRRTELRQQYRALHYMQSHGKRHTKSGCRLFYELRQFLLFFSVLLRVPVPVCAMFLFPCFWLPIDTSAFDCLEKLISKMTCYGSSTMLNPTQ